MSSAAPIRQIAFFALVVAAGLLAGQVPWLADNTIHLVVPALLAMLCTVFAQIPSRT